jgi:hypothetical protein
MPAIRTIHQSTFKVDGYIYYLNIESSILAQSSHVPTPVVSSESETVAGSDVITGNYNVIHLSEFGILIERLLSISSSVVIGSDITLHPHIELPTIQSVSEIASTPGFNVNSLMIPSDIVCGSNITARYVVPNVKTIQFGTLEFQDARRATDDSISVISDSKYTEFGIDEPLAFTRTIHINAETNRRIEHDTLINLIGQKLPLWVYGICYPDCRISNISDLHVKPKLNRFRYSIEFEQIKYNTSDSVTFAGMSLSNPTMPNAFDTTPEYGIEMASGFDAVPVPVISQRFAVECITESQSEYESMLSLMGAKSTLIINGNSYPLCYISSLSGLQPRGGGNVWKYTIEFSKKIGENPVSVTFNGISLPNATISSEEELEILQNRTILHSGAVVADIASVVSNRFTISCMANDKTVYNQLKALISQKKTLIVDGETYTKCYISSWQSARKIGDGSVRLYTWTIGFEQETA